MKMQEVEPSLVADDIIPYIENLKDTYTYTIRTNKVSKVARYKININNQVYS